MNRNLIGAMCLALLGACSTTAQERTVPATPAPDTTSEVLSGSTLWSARVPANWNGTLLVHSRGWSPSAGQPGLAPGQVTAALLAAGYALAASNYGAGGWALAEAVPAQEATIAAFTRRYGTPKRVIGFGYSMGGLVTTALAERAATQDRWRHFLLQLNGWRARHDEHRAGRRLRVSGAGSTRQRNRSRQHRQ